jgi:hypothetical protein
MSGGTTMGKPEYFSLKDNLELRILAITCDEKGYPVMVISDNKDLEKIELRIHSNFNTNVFICSRRTEDGFVPVLVKTAFVPYSEQWKPSGSFKLIYVSNILNDASVEIYVKRAVKNALKDIIKDESYRRDVEQTDTSVLLHICNEDLTKAFTFRETAITLLNKFNNILLSTKLNNNG